VTPQVADLTAIELRVLGSLIEKQATTPDQYPLTLNALLAACNQRTNRDPVVDYVDTEVIDAIGALRDRGLCRLNHAPGQRTVKYTHSLDTALDLDGPELGLLAVLMLRGPQTPGELRARTGRYHRFSGPAAVETSLDELARREPPLAVRLERRPGEKESRWRHLLGGPTDEGPEDDPAHRRVRPLEARVADLEAEVARLRDLIEGRSPAAW